jgi:D-xylose 1-dehydrogenase (NADP+, D-xylono-1,5-lactone-forming)
MDRLRWGIIGTGNIAGQFATGVRASARGTLAGAGSRSLDSARAFAGKHQIECAHGSYEALIDDPQVDAIYLSLPNSMHHEWAIKSLRAGKHVLCEKPFARTAAEAQEMFDVAQQTGRVLVEAFMYVSHPQTRAALEAVRDGTIGQLKLIRTSFCYRTNKIDGNVRFSHELAGGALMDVGCYCIHFSRLMSGQEPQAVTASAVMHERGIDEMTIGTLHFANGVLATFQCGMGVQCDNAAYVCGSDGYLEIDWPWKPPAGKGTMTIARGVPPRQDTPGTAPVKPAPPPREQRVFESRADVYGLEADAFAAVVQDHAAPALSREDTLGNMRVLDAMRRQIGLKW